ncbi:hypothetical protein CLV91_0854 [Maribacter vaceletii]|uniref:Uncharacterized protein n=1 Tax=Maribacter vaceletii TaxID=1206816 RepID=A0A495ED22_9FLAO|nr:hypothetical protein [Maribacter vaceletii]RKR14775.1 hypothetical protein CLV91_0854 [Maribacter vaceletii]
MKILIIVESPLQLINANEYISSLNQKTQCKFYFINCKSESNILQMRKVFKTLKIKGNVIEASKNNALKNFYTRTLYYIKIRTLKIKLNYNENMFDLVLMGHILSMYQTVLVNGVTSKKIVILDDGNSAYMEQKRLRKEKIFSFFSPKQVFIAKLTGCNINLNYKQGKLNFYTMYKDLITDKYSYLNFEFNNFNRLRKLLSTKVTNTEKVFFIGSPFNGKIISRDYFNKNIEKITKHYLNKQIVYFPHRYEDKEQLEVIKQFGWEITNFNLPIEIALVEMKFLPLEFAFFYSTAFVSISKLVDKNFTSFEIDSSELMLQYDLITGLYQEYVSNERINKINL